MVLAKQVSYQANFQEFLGEANQSESEDSLSGTALVHADSKNKQIIIIGRISLDFIGDKPELFRGAVARCLFYSTTSKAECKNFRNHCCCYRSKGQIDF